MDALSRRDVLEWAMAESVPVRCPACRREHLFAASSYPCVCGVLVTPPLDRLADPVPVTHRVWDDDWVTLPCDACGREDEWPHPELGCGCGTVLRIPVRGARRGGVRQAPTAGVAPGAGRDETPVRPSDPPGADEPHTAGTPAARAAVPGPAEPTPPAPGPRADPAFTGDGRSVTGSAPVDTSPADGSAPVNPAPAGNPAPRTGVSADGSDADADGGISADRAVPDGGPSVDGPAPDSARRGGDQPPKAPAASAPAPRPAFRPVTIRTARDAVTAAVLYLRWLGHHDIRRADQRPPSGIGLAARGVVAQVDPTVRPASLRDVECLWLTAMSESARCVYFSLAGYSDDARSRADLLGIPLFVLDLTGTPQPVNAPAEEFVATEA